MIERLRALRDRPLDPALARAVILLALSVALGLVTVAVLASSDRGPATSSVGARTTRSKPTGAAPSRGLKTIPAQDPQDRIGTTAHRRAAAELATHRALQHVPFRDGRVSIEMVGARGGKAVVRIEAASAGAARRAWLGFLERYRDPGTAYVPIYAGGGRRG